MAACGVCEHPLRGPDGLRGSLQTFPAGRCRCGADSTWSPQLAALRCNALSRTPSFTDTVSVIFGQRQVFGPYRIAGLRAAVYRSDCSDPAGAVSAAWMSTTRRSSSSPARMMLGSGNPAAWLPLLGARLEWRMFSAASGPWRPSQEPDRQSSISVGGLAQGAPSASTQQQWVSADVRSQQPTNSDTRLAVALLHDVHERHRRGKGNRPD